jgi:hypothetical protein
MPYYFCHAYAHAMLLFRHCRFSPFSRDIIILRHYYYSFAAIFLSLPFFMMPHSPR